MEQLDLNINNYDLEKLLQLFNLSYDFSYNDLKLSIKKLYKIHPDKSGLDPKYFMFFKRAYTIVLNIYKFRNKSNNSFRDNFYSEEKHLKLIKFMKDNNFNENFNKLYEETFKTETHGHGDWIKNMNIDTDGMNRQTYFSNMRNNIIVKNNSVTELNNFSVNNLDKNSEEEYSCDANSKLKYDDIKNVYSETFIPVKENDERIEKFNTINQLKIERQKLKLTTMNKEESEIFLEKENNNNIKKTNNRIFNLLKQDENYKKQQDLWWKKFNKLCL
jgi:hypothetical protein